MGWTPQVAWNTPMPEIFAAAKAKAKYQNPEPETPKKAPASLINARMDSMAAKINQRVANDRR